MKGIGGAPTRATTFPTDAKGRKQHPVASGVLDYFPDALVAVARVSWEGNDQHNPGQPLHWARSKSADEADALIRHFLQRGSLDSDGMRHSAKMVWRALALLQKEIEAERAEVVEEIKAANIKQYTEELLQECYEEGERQYKQTMCDENGDYVGFTPAQKMGPREDFFRDVQGAVVTGVTGGGD